MVRAERRHVHLNSGDRRYAEPRSLTFRLNRHRAFSHDIHSLEHSVLRNFLGAPFCLFPCEPNWVYPIVQSLRDDFDGGVRSPVRNQVRRIRPR